MSLPVIAVEGLTKHFAGRPRWLREPLPAIRAVDGVSLQVERGRCFAIVGESGCGKSTLARLIVGLLRPSAGAIRIDGEDLSGKSDAELRAMRRRVQLVLQDPLASLDPRMRVRQILNEALIVHGIGAGRAERAARIAAVLGQVGLGPHLAERYPIQLSGGQRQRVAIARALICEPEVIVLDEPVSALDVSVQAQIINLLTKLQAELGLTYVIITHDLSLVGYMSDAVGVMYLGRFVERGETAKVCGAPLHPYSIALLSAVAEPDPVHERTRPVEVLTGSVPSPAHVPPGCRFHTRCPLARRLGARLPPAERAETADGPLPLRCIREEPALAAPFPGTQDVACHFALVGRPEVLQHRTSVSQET